MSRQARLKQVLDSLHLNDREKMVPLRTGLRLMGKFGSATDKLNQTRVVEIFNKANYVLNDIERRYLIQKMKARDPSLTVEDAFLDAHLVNSMDGPVMGDRGFAQSVVASLLAICSQNRHADAIKNRFCLLLSPS